MLKIVPGRVKIKVSLWILLALAFVFSPWILPLPLSFRAGLFAVILGAGLYALWCFWPKWSWGLRTTRLTATPVHITFDDGPTPGLTDAVLDILKAQKRQASFFVLVDKVERAPALIRRIVDEGHILGLHGQDHRLPFFRTTKDLKASLGLAKQKLETLAGRPVALFRPSHGWKNPALVRAVHELNLQFCFWDWGVWDTDNPPAADLSRRLERAQYLAQTSQKGVILLHDGLGDDLPPPAHSEVLKTVLKTKLGLLKEHS